MKKLLPQFQELPKYFEGKKLFNHDLVDILSKTAMGLLMVIVIVWLMPSERPFEYGNLLVGSIAQEEIIAPFTFPIIKTEDVLAREREEAQRKVSPVFNRDAEIKNVQLIKLKNLMAELSAYMESQQRARKRSKPPIPPLTENETLDSLLNQVSVKYNVNLAPDDFLVLYEVFQQGQFRDFSQNIIAGFGAIYDRGIINLPEREVGRSEIAVIHNNMEEIIRLERLYDRDEAELVLGQFLRGKYSDKETVFQLAAKLGIAFLMPDHIFNRELTLVRQEKAFREVPATSGFVHENQRIIDSHEIVTDEVYQKLQSLAIALSEKSAAMSHGYRFLFLVGKYIFALVITLMIGYYLFYYQPKLFNQNKMMLLITCIFILQFLIAALIQNVLKWPAMSIPITLGPMLLSMLLDSPIAFMGTIMISLVLGAAAGNNFLLALMAFIVGTVSLYSVQKIRNRGQMFRAILFIILGYAAVNFSFGFIHYESIHKMIQNFAFYQVPNAVLVPTAVFLLIGIFEKFFDVTTDITLLELSDLNHPLLKRLSVEAPGTFHHSIIVGNLAEAAAKEIGANSLLARVGCYYHDIGKMQLSEYFVENQSGAISKHESLTPSMSSLILAKHVRAGVELAESYRLPLAVRKFIPEHHGTSVMSYFYHKAQETLDLKDINENDFRYPGPRPQSKETAIAMLSDTVEAASRTLPNPNIQRISTLVENLIEKRFQEGELDECDITLRELNKIKGAFIRVLMGIHHLRIEYPSEDKVKEPSRARETAAEPLDSAAGNAGMNPPQSEAESKPPRNGRKPANPGKSDGQKKENPH